MRGIPSLRLDLEFPSLVSAYRIPILIFVRGVIVLVLRKGPSYHHLLHIEDLFLLVEIR
ncbi:Hypothetical protein FKW44_009773 [Caligus rogercresseyi]|uniref:Uncharacterized protein n=1 Tax=Caligus rogercresseyi TaxID=217165 RepID=A0A7T8K7Q3_CALRO|nr:Hypothetical protein FKW44_009773 [Caligus rogercresseyi]